MWIQTHQHMANLVHRHVKDKYGLELKQDMLQYGSVKPDLFWRYTNVPHYYEKGFSFFLEELSRLLKDSKYRDTREFSIQLGVLLHFTADFFCFAHNDEEYKTNLLSHFNYEIKLHRAFMRYEAKDLNCPRFSNPAVLIINLRKKYVDTVAGLEKDIDYITYACFSLTDLLIEAVLLPLVRTA